MTANTIQQNIKQPLAKQIERISLEISEKWNDINDVGLLGGRSGIVLLFAYLTKLFPGKGHEATTLYYLNELKDSLMNDELQHDLPGGIAGIGFVFQHLKNLQVLESWVDLDLSELDELIEMGAERDFRNGNWDPLHGLCGLGIYFLERHKETGETKYLEKIVEYLSLMRMTAEGHDVWITPGNKNYRNDTYNFGFAHGMPGVLSFLSQVHMQGIKQIEIQEMTGSCLSFLLQHEYRDDPVYSFPSVINVTQMEKTNRSDSRLGWCYGDLCMANALIHCGKALHNSDWYKKGISVALKTTHRTFEDSGCVDAPFCHGTVGLVHQYNRLYQLTQNKIFEDASNKWIGITQTHFYKQGEGAGGYYYSSYDERVDRIKLIPQYGLLEGSAGIALVYLSILYGINPDWDIIFLTNV